MPSPWESRRGRSATACLYADVTLSTGGAGIPVDPTRSMRWPLNGSRSNGWPNAVSEIADSLANLSGSSSIRCRAFVAASEMSALRSTGSSWLNLPCASA